MSARNARGDTYGRKILKCLKWPDSYSPLIVKWFWAFLNFDARVRARHDLYVTFDDMTLLTLDLKYMWYEYEWPLLMHHEDMMDNVISQNGAWMTSRWPDDLENVPVTSHDNDLWLCQNWMKLTKSNLSYPRHKKVAGNKNKIKNNKIIINRKFNSSRRRIRWSV